MIVADTDILSAFAKIGQFDLLCQLLRVEQLNIVPAVLSELEVARIRQHSFTNLLFNNIATQRIVTLDLTPSEVAFAANLSIILAQGERESMAVAYQRNAILLSNESRVAHWNRRIGIKYLNLPMILRALWTEALLTQEEVRFLILELEVHDRMGFSAKTLADIFI